MPDIKKIETSEKLNALLPAGDRMKLIKALKI